MPKGCFGDLAFPCFLRMPSRASSNRSRASINLWGYVNTMFLRYKELFYAMARYFLISQNSST